MHPQLCPERTTETVAAESNAIEGGWRRKSSEEEEGAKGEDGSKRREGRAGGHHGRTVVVVVVVEEKEGKRVIEYGEVMIEWRGEGPQGDDLIWTIVALLMFMWADSVGIHPGTLQPS